MPRRKGADPAEINAYPRAAWEEIGSVPPPPESGLSIEAEDIGSQFLSNATEQAPPLWPGEDAVGESLEEEEWESGGGLAEAFQDLDPASWERAITRSLRVGRLSSEDYPSARTKLRRRAAELEEPPAHSWDELDLTDESIQEASLLDHEGAELGEVESPPLRTDDVHTHGRRRRGHLLGARGRRLGG